MGHRHTTGEEDPISKHTRNTRTRFNTYKNTYNFARARRAPCAPGPRSTERLHRTQVTGYLQACTLTFRQSTETAHKHEIRFCKLRAGGEGASGYSTRQSKSPTHTTGTRARSDAYFKPAYC